MFGRSRVRDADESHVIVEHTPEDRRLYDKFMKEYDVDGDMKFNSIQFRKGARFTGHFGLDNGFKWVDGKMQWGWIRLHAGVDRAGGKAVQTKHDGMVDDPVMVPFNFNRSFMHEYGDKSYGTLVRLYNDEYGFELRVAHMNPDQNKRKANEKGPMIKWYYQRAKAKKSFDRDWTMGSAGSWGYSTGAHTHTELKSLDEACEVFEILLLEKFGSKALKEYTAAQAIKEYRKQSQYKDATDEKILQDYADLKKTKKVLFLNQYKCQYIDWDNTVKTRYSSYHLFGM